ncbi:MAG TPA: pentapeptide repeat-containing protein [Flavobacterium sp.]|jgi:uncharacterized protein YjbI with pentapeptide repeats
MEDLIHINKTFNKTVFSNATINNREFDSCIFKNCDFSNSDFSKSTFLDCEFIDCNLGMVKLSGTSLKNVRFQTCKLLGILFHECDDFLFEVHFQNCILDYASFSNKKMTKTKFDSCSIKEVNFSNSNLTNAVFHNCDLDRAVFNETQLAGVDFRSAYNFKIDPEFNPMKKAKFSGQGIIGLLDKYDIKIE